MIYDAFIISLLSKSFKESIVNRVYAYFAHQGSGAASTIQLLACGMKAGWKGGDFGRYGAEKMLRELIARKVQEAKWRRDNGYPEDDDENDGAPYSWREGNPNLRGDRFRGNDGAGGDRFRGSDRRDRRDRDRRDRDRDRRGDRDRERDRGGDRDRDRERDRNRDGERKGSLKFQMLKGNDQKCQMIIK
jgi:hypothetical protein